MAPTNRNVPVMPRHGAAIASGMPAETIWWISFDLELVAAVHAAVPGTQGWHVAHVPPTEAGAAAEASAESICIRLIDKAAAAGLNGVDIAAIPDVVTQAVHDYAKSQHIEVAVWVSSGLATRYELQYECQFSTY